MIASSRNDHQVRARAPSCGGMGAHELTATDQLQFHSSGSSRRCDGPRIDLPRAAATRDGLIRSSRFFFSHEAPVEGRQSLSDSACVRTIQHTLNDTSDVLGFTHNHVLSSSAVTDQRDSRSAGSVPNPSGEFPKVRGTFQHERG